MGGQARQFVEVRGDPLHKLADRLPTSGSGVGVDHPPPVDPAAPERSGQLAGRAPLGDARARSRSRLETHLHAEALSNDAGRLLGPEQIARQHHRDAGPLELTGGRRRLPPPPLGEPGASSV